MGDRFCQFRQVKKLSRKNIVYDLSFVQQPKCARTVGYDLKIGRSPINPPPIIQLNVINPSGSPNFRRSSSFQTDPTANDNTSLARDQKGKEGFKTETGLRSKGQSFLQNPYYFMNATLTNAIPDAKTGIYQDLHASKDGKTRFLVGSTVSSLFQFQIQLQKDVGVFVFPDLCVRQEGEYRVRFDLYEILGKEIHICRSILSEVFQAYSPKQPLAVDERGEPIRSSADSNFKSRARNIVPTANKLARSLRQGGNSQVPASKRLTASDRHDGDRSSSHPGKTGHRRRSTSSEEQRLSKRPRMTVTEMAERHEEPWITRSVSVHDESHVFPARGSASVGVDSHGRLDDVVPQQHTRTSLFPSSTPSSSQPASHRPSYRSDDSLGYQASSHSPVSSHQSVPALAPAPASASASAPAPAPAPAPTPTTASTSSTPTNSYFPRLTSNLHKSVGSSLVEEPTSNLSASQVHPPSDLLHPPAYRNHHIRHHPHDQPSNIVLPPIHSPVGRPSSPSLASSSSTPLSSYQQWLSQRSTSNETSSDDKQLSNANRQSPIDWTSRMANSPFPRKFSISSSSTSLDRSSSYGSTISSSFSPAIGYSGDGMVLEGGEVNPSRPSARVIHRATDSSMPPPEFTRLDSSSRSRPSMNRTRRSTASPVMDKRDLKPGPADTVIGLGQASSSASVAASAFSTLPLKSSGGERKTFPGLGLKEMLNPSTEEGEKAGPCCPRHPFSENSLRNPSVPSNPAVTSSFSASRMGLHNLLS